MWSPVGLFWKFVYWCLLGWLSYSLLVLSAQLFHQQQHHSTKLKKKKKNDFRDALQEKIESKSSQLLNIFPHIYFDI